MTNDELKNFINKNNKVEYVHTYIDEEMQETYYLISIASGSVNNSYIFKYTDEAKTEPEILYECDYANVTNKFWYDTDGKLIPGKFFTTDKNISNLIQLNKLDRTGINSSFVKLEEIKNYDFGVSLYPSDTETVGKINWAISDNIAEYLVSSVSRDTMQLSVTLNETKLDDIKETVNISGTITATALNNQHDTILNNGTIDWVANVYRYVEPPVVLSGMSVDLNYETIFNNVEPKVLRDLINLNLTIYENESDANRITVTLLPEDATNKNLVNSYEYKFSFSNGETLPETFYKLVNENNNEENTISDIIDENGNRVITIKGENRISFCLFSVDTLSGILNINCYDNDDNIIDNLSTGDLNFTGMLEYPYTVYVRDLEVVDDENIELKSVYNSTNKYAGEYTLITSIDDLPEELEVTELPFNLPVYIKYETTDDLTLISASFIYVQNKGITADNKIDIFNTTWCINSILSIDNISDGYISTINLINNPCANYKTTDETNKFIVGVSVEPGKEIEMLEVKTSVDETWMIDSEIVTKVEAGQTIALNVRAIPENSEATVNKYEWFITNATEPVLATFVNENGEIKNEFEIGETTYLICENIPAGSYFGVNALDFNNDIIISSVDFAIETFSTELDNPDNSEDTTFKELNRVSPTEETTVIYNDGSDSTNEEEIELSVKILPENSTDNVTIKWTSDTVGLLKSEDGFSCTTTSFNCNEASVHTVTAIPVVNEEEQPDKAITWTFEFNSTCRLCGQSAPGSWTICPHCGTAQ